MILIDYSSIAISNVIVQGLAIDENLIRHMILNSLRMYRVKYGKEYGELVICCDARNNWRRDVFPQYKFKRATAREDSKIDWEALFQIIEKIKSELMEYFPYKVVEVDKCEADDVIAHIAFSTNTFGNYEPVMIISADKDFVQLQTMNWVKQYSNTQKKYVVEKNPTAYLLEHIIRGDSGDGVPNVLSDDNVFVEGRKQVRMTEKRRNAIFDKDKKLIATGETLSNIERNIRMIDLSKTPDVLIQQIINNYNDNTLHNRGNKSKVMKYLMDNRCRLLLERVEEFTQ